MLAACGVPSFEALLAGIPPEVRLQRPLDLPAALPEPDLVRHLESLARKNRVAGEVTSFLGAGSYDHFIPSALEVLAGRSEFVTAYTPYQPEASPGILQATFEYQSLICALTGMEVSNASLYDGATALAEACRLAAEATGRPRVAISEGVHPEYREVARCSLAEAGIEVRTIPRRGALADPAALAAAGEGAAAVVAAQPNFFGGIEDLAAFAEAARRGAALLVVSANPIALGVLKPPGAVGADVVVGEGQPLGCPPSYGGPTFAFLATRRAQIRRLPGRLVGETTDRRGRRCFVLTLQTREQHIRRERATSNICTNQALFALRGAIYLALLGPEGLREVAGQCVRKAHALARRIASIPGFRLPFEADPFFHEFVVRPPVPAGTLLDRLVGDGFLGGVPLAPWCPDLSNAFLVAVTEQRTRDEIDRFVEALARCSR